jgi:hypothetical protein
MSKKVSNEITDWYSKIGAKKPDLKQIKGFEKHHILPETRILALGPSGSGKSTMLMEFLSRVGDRFFEFYLFTGSTTNEPIYNFLKEKIPDIKMFDDINQFPNLKDIEEDDNEKIVVFDDFINLDVKGMRKIKEWIISSRKKHFTCIFMAQNLAEIPTQIRRNINYFAVFKMNDDFLIKYVLKNYAFGVPKNAIIKMYEFSTEKPKNFFFIDTLTNDPHWKFRHNLLQGLDPKDFMY